MHCRLVENGKSNYISIMQLQANIDDRIDEVSEEPLQDVRFHGVEIGKHYILGDNTQRSFCPSSPASSGIDQPCV